VSSNTKRAFNMGSLETALVGCDQVLQREGMRRTDVLKCVSFEEIDPEDNDVCHKAHLSF
jgi:hypothetical protein